VATTPPKIVGHGAEQMRLMCFVRIAPDKRHVAGNSLAGPGPREVAGMAVYEDEKGYYLFSCDAEWNVMFDSWFESVEDAVAGTEYDWEYVQAE
jgi:hypothetical protein